MQTTQLTKSQRIAAKVALKLRDAQDAEQAESRKLEAEREATLAKAMAERPESLEANGTKPETPAESVPVVDTPAQKDDGVNLHLLKGRGFKATRVAKEIDDSRSAVGRMVIKTDVQGDRITGSDKKGTAVYWEGLALRPCQNKTEQRAQAITKASAALARALAMPKGDTL